MTTTTHMLADGTPVVRTSEGFDSIAGALIVGDFVWFSSIGAWYEVLDRSLRSDRWGKLAIRYGIPGDTCEARQFTVRSAVDQPVRTKVA